MVLKTETTSAKNVVMAASYQVADSKFFDQLQAHPEEQDQYLFLEHHPEFQGFWKVEGLDNHFVFDFKELIGPYRVVSPATLEEFLDLASELNYKVSFLEEPSKVIGSYEKLNTPPPFELNSSLEGTINGLLPYQLQGFNYLKDLKGGVALWSTGVGKTLCAISLLKYHEYDVALYVVKSHNKINTQRSLKRFGSLESVVVDGSKKKRDRLWDEALESPGQILVTNYEKFRYDKEKIQKLFEGRKVCIVWDEAPTRLKNRTTKLYRSVSSCIYTCPPPAVNSSQLRPSSIHQWVLSATPIENSPEDYFNVVRLIDPSVFGTVKNFHDEYVKSYSYFSPTTPETWHNLDKMALKAAHITHRVDKTDPDIADQFPNVIDEPLYIDWDPSHRKLYDKLTSKAAKINFEEVNVLALITVLQMICDAPSMVLNSGAMYEAYEGAVTEWMEGGGKEPSKEGSEAALQLISQIGKESFTDSDHTKLLALKELITEIHKDESLIVFSSFNDGLLPILEKKFAEWGVSHVRYTGDQEQEDKFMRGEAQVFLSSDMGSDSLSLEQGSAVIHYDLPWKHSTLTQRQNRIHRVVSQHDTVRYYKLMMADSIEDRKLKIIQQKKKFHEQIFDGQLSDQSLSARMSAEDFRYILLG